MSALIVDDPTTLDILAKLPAVEVRADRLREGMVLLDDLDLPVAVVDHRMPTQRGTGAARFMLADLERGGWTETSIAWRRPVKVAAR